MALYLDEMKALPLEERDATRPHTTGPVSVAPKIHGEGDSANAEHSPAGGHHTDEPSTVATSDGSEAEDLKHVVHLSTPETETREDHRPSALEPSCHSPHRDVRLPVEAAFFGSVTTETRSLDNSCTTALGCAPTVAKLEFSPLESISPPNVIKPSQSSHVDPPISPKSWMSSSADENSEDDDDFGHVVHLSTPEGATSRASLGISTAASHTSFESSPLLASAPCTASTCITAVGKSSCKSQSSSWTLLNFSPDFSKGLSAFVPHLNNNEQNAFESVVVNGDIKLGDRPPTATSFDGGASPSSTVDKENMWKEGSATHLQKKGLASHQERPHLPAASKSSLESSGTVSFAGLDGSSGDEDEKLDNLFQELRIRSTKKNTVTRTVSRKSLEAFIVSDSDEGEDEDVTEAPLPATPSIMCTPCNTTGSKGGAVRRPFTERPQLCTPVCSTYRKPAHTQCASALTPSAHKSFARNKDQMARELYQLFNQTIFNNQLPENMEIKWNRKMRTTAGYCCNTGLSTNRSSRIELSQKVCNSYDRIRDTLIHEMCHAATWLISGVKKGGHGSEWQAWATMANKVYPSIKRIERCHNYDIDYKYMYKCTRCDFRHGRHSKSVDLEHKRCPRCMSTLQLEPKLNVDGTPASSRKLTRYAQFIQDNYSDVKKALPLMTHKEIMEVLREKYHAQQAEVSQGF